MIQYLGRTWWLFEVTRNDPNINQFNRLISIYWLTNTDISPYIRIKAIINYVTKYYSKIEVQINTYGQITKSILPYISDRNLILSFVSKIINKLIGKRDYSAQETCYILLKLSLYKDSCIILSV